MKRYLIIFVLLLAAAGLSAQTVANLVATGSNIKWYAASTGGSALATSTALVNATTYYASQTINGVESTARFAVTVTVNPLPTPTFIAQPGTTAYTATDVTYTTESGKTNYIWTFPGTLNTDYTITSGGGNSNSVTLKYITTGSKTVTIKYSANGCTAASATSSTATTVSSLLAVGDTYGGGIVAYLYVSGDPGYSSTVQHGLIAASSDQNAENNIEWSRDAIWSSTSTYSYAIGMGSSNTTTIINFYGNWGTYAAKTCRDYTDGVYHDWFLPSLMELHKLYLNQIAIGGFNSAKCYWSSSESSNNLAKQETFSNANQSSAWKFGSGTIFRVRAVRYF